MPLKNNQDVTSHNMIIRRYMAVYKVQKVSYTVVVVTVFPDIPFIPVPRALSLLVPRLP